MAVISRRMREVAVGVGILFLALLIIAKLDSEQAVRFVGPFTVVDGDTLSDGRQRLRLRGIDAPEIGQLCTRPSGVYDCGLVARAVLMRFLEGRIVECQGRARDQDRYGRALVTCRSGIVDLGREMVDVGFAAADGDYHMGERRARDAGLGIWAGPFEQPEDWRRRRRLEPMEPVGWLQTFLLGPLHIWFGRREVP